MLPEDLAARIAGIGWPVPPVFTWLAAEGGVPLPEMLRTFNCGIGMILVAAPVAAKALCGVLRAAGERVHVIGRIERRAGDGPQVRVEDLEATWPR